MSDDRTKKSPQDRNRIDVHQDYQLRYWRKARGVTPEELKSAVQKVGPSTNPVRENLGK